MTRDIATSSAPSDPRWAAAVDSAPRRVRVELSVPRMRPCVGSVRRSVISAPSSTPPKMTALATISQTDSTNTAPTRP